MSKLENTSYPVFIGDDSLSEIKKYIFSGRFSSVVILTDENVNKNCLPVLLEKCESLKSAIVIEIPDGEDQKNISVSAKIISMLLENNADRKSLLINLGGGVISDLGGFIASVYKRGIKFINIPTTLLSMVDASIGGKNGVNFLDKKNIIGTFTNPSALFIYPDFIKTLSAKDVRSGYAEIIKHILLSDSLKSQELILNKFSLMDEKNLSGLLNESTAFKLAVTESDFKETGRRNILNFGHTIGHALEGFSQQTDNPLRHGEAIAAGMIAELYLSFKTCEFPEAEMISIVRLIRNIFNDITVQCTSEDLIPFLFADKKNANDSIGFSLLKSPGVPSAISYPDLEFILESISFMVEEFSRTAVQ